MDAKIRLSLGPAVEERAVMRPCRDVIDVPGPRCVSLICLCDHGVVSLFGWLLVGWMCETGTASPERCVPAIVSGTDGRVVLGAIELAKAIGNGDNERGLGRIAALAARRLA